MELTTSSPLDFLEPIIAAVAHRAGAHHQRKGDVHALVCPFDDGRSQLVTVSEISSWTNRPIVLFYSVIGKYSPDLDLRLMMGTSLSANYARLCLVQGDFLAVAASLHLDECDRSRVVAAVELRIREVALLADNLEQEFFGADVF